MKQKKVPDSKLKQYSTFFCLIFFTRYPTCVCTRKKYEEENFDPISVQVAKLTWREEWCGGYLAADSLNQSSWMYSLTKANSPPPVLQSYTY